MPPRGFPDAERRLPGSVTFFGGGLLGREKSETASERTPGAVCQRGAAGEQQALLRVAFIALVAAAMEQCPPAAAGATGVPGGPPAPGSPSPAGP